MCGVLVILMAAAALAAFIVLARSEARRKDKRARTDWSEKDDHVAVEAEVVLAASEAEPERYVTVAELVKREAMEQRQRRLRCAASETTTPLSTVARLRPSPHPRGVRQ